MKIEGLSELERLLKLCRRQGVSAISVDGIELQLGAEPQARKPKSEAAADSVETPDGYTEDDVLTWSAANG